MVMVTNIFLNWVATQIVGVERYFGVGTASDSTLATDTDLGVPLGINSSGRNKVNETNISSDNTFTQTYKLSSTEPENYQPINIQELGTFRTLVTANALIDNCETANWTQNADASNDTLDAVVFKQGSNSIKMGKTGTSGSVIYYEKTQSSVDCSAGNKRLGIWVYITDTDSLATTTALEIWYGNDSSNYLKKTYDKANLSDGWNLANVGVNVTDMTQVGTVSLSAMDYTRIVFNTPTSATTITHGNLKMDYWHLITTTTDLDTRFVLTNPESKDSGSEWLLTVEGKVIEG
jgi:hypothetical protein